MANLRSLPDRAVLRDVFAAFPHTSRPLLDYHQALLRGPSPLAGYFGVAAQRLAAQGYASLLAPPPLQGGEQGGSADGTGASRR
jgi:hypothetical protein